MDTIVYSLLLKKIKGVATGVSTARYDGDSRSVIFTTNNGVELSIPMPNGLTTQEIEMISHLTIESEEDGTLYLALDGERIGSKTCSFTTSVEVGALKSGTKLENRECADVLHDILVAKYPPAISFTSSVDQTKVYEIGASTDIELQIKTTKQSYDIKKLEITSTPSLAEFTKTVSTAPWTHSGTVTISDSQTITAKVTDVEGLSSTKTIKYNFVYPLYASYVDASVTEITEADIISGQKVIKPKQAITLAYTSNDTLLRPVFAFDASYGQLKKITDVLNQIELMSDYTMHEVQIETLDGNMTDYYVYVANTEAILDNFEIKFSW